MFSELLSQEVEQWLIKGFFQDVRTAVFLEVPKQIFIFAISEMFDVKTAGLKYREYTFDMETGKCGGYICSSEKGIPFETAEENIKMMLNTAREYSIFDK
jgi:hypothetical protein